VICVANTVCAWTVVDGPHGYCSLAATQSDCETADTEASCIANPMCSWQDVARCGVYGDNTPCARAPDESMCAVTLDCEWHSVSFCDASGCSDHGNESACASASCSWSGRCSSSVDCDNIQDSGNESACSAHPSCRWDAGRCDSVCHVGGRQACDQAGCDWTGVCGADDPQSCLAPLDSYTCNSNAPCMWATKSLCVPPGFDAYYQGVQDAKICMQEKSEPECTAVVITTTTAAVATEPLGDRAIAGSLPSAKGATSSDSADMGLRTGVVLVLSLITATLWN